MRNFTLIGAALLAAEPLAAAEDEIPFAVANVIAELNNTDGDLGFHALIDGDPWKLMEIRDPSGARVLRVRPTGRLRMQGLTEIFFESAEPEFDELSPEEFFARFPEGVYEISGVSTEGDAMESEAAFSHVMPAPPEFLSPEQTDCDDPVWIPAGPVLIEWAPVTASHPEIGRSDPGIVIAGYELALSREDGPALSLNFRLGPDVTAVTAPPELVTPGHVYKYEVLVREATGNQTAEEGCFELGAP